MNDYLQKATDDYSLLNKDISAISKIDAEIISILPEIFKKIDQEDIADMIEKWKKVKDVDVLSELRSFIENGSNIFRKFICVEEFMIETKYIVSIVKQDGYCNVRRLPKYSIIFNKDDSEKLLNCNHEIVFYSSKKRDKQLEKIKEKLKYFNIKFL